MEDITGYHLTPARTLPFLCKLFSLKAFKQVQNVAGLQRELQQLSRDLQPFCNCLFMPSVPAFAGLEYAAQNCSFM